MDGGGSTPSGLPLKVQVLYSPCSLFRVYLPQTCATITITKIPSTIIGYLDPWGSFSIPTLVHIKLKPISPNPSTLANKLLKGVIFGSLITFIEGGTTVGTTSPA